MGENANRFNGPYLSNLSQNRCCRCPQQFFRSRCRRFFSSAVGKKGSQQRNGHEDGGYNTNDGKDPCGQCGGYNPEDIEIHPSAKPLVAPNMPQHLPCQKVSLCAHGAAKQHQAIMVKCKHRFSIADGNKCIVAVVANMHDHETHEHDCGPQQQAGKKPPNPVWPAFSFDPGKCDGDDDGRNDGRWSGKDLEKMLQCHGIMR